MVACGCSRLRENDGKEGECQHHVRLFRQNYESRKVYGYSLITMGYSLLNVPQALQIQPHLTLKFGIFLPKICFCVSAAHLSEIISSQLHNQKPKEKPYIISWLFLDFQIYLVNFQMLLIFSLFLINLSNHTLLSGALPLLQEVKTSLSLTEISSHFPLKTSTASGFIPLS